MNAVLNTIKGRRTTRKFTSQPVSRDQMEVVIEAGLFAPSGHNKQPWHFTVVNNQELMNEMNDAVKNLAKASADPMIQRMAQNEQFHIFYNAPAMVVVSGSAEMGVTMREDCAAAAQNMLLAAESIGLGACWNGMVSFLFNSPMASEYAQKLQLPEGFAPLYAIVLGEKAVEATQAPARRPSTVTYL